ncbi:hypothetical protein [Cupriavidus sp. D39]|uniref:hypothetical protein n=1 Tax=Cupriavidus sp. D39 TaxID=2997877 RepID=UPI0022709611|nr:hypothetical protein [Cupriavidus sp. D39]MCY0854705.1 hypothetical protein [Cupriavidus sp. D39]
MQNLKQAILTTAITMMFSGIAAAATVDSGSSDTPQDGGGRVTQKRDPFTDGAHGGSRDLSVVCARSASFDGYSDGR